MRDTTATLGEVLKSSFGARLIADVFYDDERTLKGLDVGAYTLQWDIEGEIKGNGYLDVVYQGGTGDSLTPREFTDRLAPFGQEVNLLMEITAGTFSETVMLGRYRIVAAPTASDRYAKFMGRQVVTGTTLRVNIADLLVGVQREGLRWPSPPLRSTTYAEMQRLSGLPILESVPDAPIPTGVIYEPKDGGRLEAVQMLASWLGGTAVVTALGELTVVPFEPGDVVNTISMGEDGRILDVQTGMDSEGVYNEVVGTYQSDDGTPFYSVASINSGPLAVSGPYGRYTFNDTAQGVQTQGQANIRARQQLDRLISGQSYRITVTCVLDPRVEVGDMVTLNGPLEFDQDDPTDEGTPAFTDTGRVLSCGFGTDNTMTITLDVARHVGE
jgi:hypothetical protein